MIKLLRHSDYQKKIWKNGRGSTLEIAVSPAGAEFDWRLSMADIIESGPFSEFPGMERLLVLLEGPEIQLSHPPLSKQHTLALFHPYRFSGDWSTQANVTGVGRDFNLIYRRDKFRGEVLVKSYLKSHESVIDEEGMVAIFCLQGKILTELGELGAYDTLLIDNDRLSIRTEGETGFLFIHLRSIHHRHS